MQPQALGGRREAQAGGAERGMPAAGAFQYFWSCVGTWRQRGLARSPRFRLRLKRGYTVAESSSYQIASALRMRSTRSAAPTHHQYHAMPFTRATGRVRLPEEPSVWP